MHVPFVGSSAVERKRTKEASPGLLENDAHRNGAQSEAAEFARQLRPVDPRLPRFVSQRLNIARAVLLGGDDFIANECRHAIAQLDEVRREFEIHVSPGGSRRSWRPPARRPRTWSPCRIAIHDAASRP